MGLVPQVVSKRVLLVVVELGRKGKEKCLTALTFLVGCCCAVKRSQLRVGKKEGEAKRECLLAESNRLPTAYEAVALPNELRRPFRCEEHVPQVVSRWRVGSG